jgi:hypothetical protein
MNTIGSVVLLLISIGVMLFYVRIAKAIQRIGVAKLIRDSQK